MPSPTTPEGSLSGDPDGPKTRTPALGRVYSWDVGHSMPLVLMATSTGCQQGGGPPVSLRTGRIPARGEPSGNGRCVSPLVSPPCRPRLIGRNPCRMRIAHAPHTGAEGKVSRMRRRRSLLYVPSPSLSLIVAFGQGRRVRCRLALAVREHPFHSDEEVTTLVACPMSGLPFCRQSTWHPWARARVCLTCRVLAWLSLSSPFRWSWPTLDVPRWMAHQPGPGTPDDQLPLGRSRQSAGLRFDANRSRETEKSEKRMTEEVGGKKKIKVPDTQRQPRRCHLSCFISRQPTITHSITKYVRPVFKPSAGPLSPVGYTPTIGCV